MKSDYGRKGIDKQIPDEFVKDSLEKGNRPYNFKGLLELYNDNYKTGKWIYRGVEKIDYALESTLERTVVSLSGIGKDDMEGRRDILKNGLKDIGTGRQVEMDRLELGIIRTFQRQYHHYSVHVPEKNDYLGWLSIMRHYGTPTRLLDWTYSFWIAVFFAVSKAEGPSVVWAIPNSTDKANECWMNKALWKILKGHGLSSRQLKDDQNMCSEGTFSKYFMPEKPIPFVWRINPHHTNERMAVQQGIFMCPGDVKKTFVDNLIATLKAGKIYCPDKPMHRIIISGEPVERLEILRGLYDMNMTQSSLLPGIQGFSESFRIRMAIPEMLAPKWLDADKDFGTPDKRSLEIS